MRRGADEAEKKDAQPSKWAFPTSETTERVDADPKIRDGDDAPMPEDDNAVDAAGAAFPILLPEKACII